MDKFATLRPITAPIALDSARWPIYNKEETLHETRTALLQRRRKENLDHNEKGMRAYEKAQEAVVHPWLGSRERAECQERAKAQPPPKKVRSEEIEKARQDARLTVGLTATMVSCNPERTRQDPVAHTSGNVWYENPGKFTFVGYRDKPEFGTRTKLMDKRREQMLDDLEEGVTKVAATFKPQIQRLKDREDQYFLQNQLAMADPNNRVRGDCMRERREANVKQLVTMWGSDPKPPDNEARRADPDTRTAFWKFKGGYTEQPPEQSHMDRTQNQKWWKKVPERYMAPEPDTWGRGGPLDAYERPYTKPSSRKTMIIGKVTNDADAGSIEKVDPSMKQPYMPKVAPRNDIRGNNPNDGGKPQYLTDEAVEALDNRTSTVPMYSSFTADRIFREPTSRPRTSTIKFDEGRSEVSGSQDLEGYLNNRAGYQPLRPAPMMKEVLMQRAENMMMHGTADLQSSGLARPRPAAVTSSQEGSPAKLGGMGSSKSLLHRGTKVRSSGFMPRRDSMS